VGATGKREREKIIMLGKNSTLLTREIDLILVKLAKERKTVYFFQKCRNQLIRDGFYSPLGQMLGLTMENAQFTYPWVIPELEP
jgi:hypothetical protein